MKKLIIFFSALALISSCAKIELNEPVQNDQSNDSGHPKVLNASVVDEQDTETRTYVDGKTVMWQPGDIISHFYDNHRNVPYVYNGETPASNVELEYYSDIDNSGIVNPAVKYSRSVYPFDSQTAITVEDVYPSLLVNLNRQLNYAIASEDLDEDVVPFAGKSLGDGVTLGEQVHTLLPYMFSNSGITSLKIPATVMEIKDNAFYNCAALASVRFEAGSEPLTIGFQPGSDERGPFYQSPLTNIYVNRELVASETYAAARDQWDEGIFSTSFYDDDDPKVTVTLQGNVKTISDYMFSGVQMETIWIPREVKQSGAFYYCSRLHGMTLAHSGTYPRLIEDDTTSDGGGAFKWTKLNNGNLNNIVRWIALEDGSDENVKMFKGAPNWSYYAYIIQAQKK